MVFGRDKTTGALQPGATGSQAYRSDIELGQRYRDEQTGYEGVATALMFFQHACERVELESIKDDRSIIAHAFDAPRLVHVASGRQAVSERPGGPGDDAPGRHRSLSR